MVAEIVESHNWLFGNGYYIDDGSRTIRHETAFQDYLEKYFGFRKAYCKLHVKYRFPVNVIVRLFYPMRAIIGTRTGIGSRVRAVLQMEEIVRGQKRDNLAN